MIKKKYKLKKSIEELVDSTLNLIRGDNKDHVNSNVRAAKTMDNTINATTQPYSWNKKLGSGAEYFSDASFSISEKDDKLKKNKSLSENKVLDMVEELLKKRSDFRDIDTPTTIPEFDEFKEKHPIVAKDITILTDEIKDKKEEIGEYGATILSSIMDSFDVDQISPKVKKILINKLKGISYNGI